MFKDSLQTWWRPGDERCGIIDLKGLIVEKKNWAEDCSHYFTFELSDLKDVQATWHTHPENVTANLSIADHGFFKSWVHLTHFIVSSTEVRCYIVLNGLVYQIDEDEDLPSRTFG